MPPNDEKKLQNAIPESEVGDRPEKPSNERNSDQGKLQEVYESQKKEGGVRGRDAQHHG